MILVLGATGKTDGVSPGVEQALGRPAATCADRARRHAATFR